MILNYTPLGVIFKFAASCILMLCASGIALQTVCSCELIDVAVLKICRSGRKKESFSRNITSA
jgi:hypothetical protein